ncbi:hypothetical protein cand_028880 [Cryptosporidium andersoni]|uniref:Uncharacterized protein n=1 Tax=Cryptosporidium andersoni TaxID=117008 RepID=A0A1J4MQZ2_9CRYT|nr:hypothetical protein cand_028880 [Cryptosporidium andersoni]
MSRIYESDHAKEFDDIKNEDLTPSDQKDSPEKLSNSHKVQEEENRQVSDEIINQNNISKQKSIINNILHIISFPWYMLKILINLLFRGKWKLKTLHCFENFFININNLPIARHSQYKLGYEQKIPNLCIWHC